MSSKQAIEQTRENLLDKARAARDEKNKAAKAKYDEIMKKAQEIYDKQIASASEKYQEFVAKVEEDTDKRLKIVGKVIDAEAEERLFKEDQIRKKKESEAREAAERKMMEEMEKQRQIEEEKAKKAEEKKKAKARKKMLAQRAKVPCIGGFKQVPKSKNLYAKLKKINSAGRYGFCCFYHPKGDGKKFSNYCEELSQTYNNNISWFNCRIQDMNFEEAMLLYEFNATPAVVVCYEGKPSNLHRYVIGWTDDSKETLKRYAEKADAE